MQIRKEEINLKGMVYKQIEMWACHFVKIFIIKKFMPNINYRPNSIVSIWDLLLRSGWLFMQHQLYLMANSERLESTQGILTYLQHLLPHHANIANKGYELSNMLVKFCLPKFTTDRWISTFRNLIIWNTICGQYKDKTWYSQLSKITLKHKHIIKKKKNTE